jgi:hypothetical protein
MTFLLGSAGLGMALAIFANRLFDWTNRLTRKLGFNRLAGFRERLRNPLLPTARLVLILTALLIIVLTFRQPE